MIRFSRLCSINTEMPIQFSADVLPHVSAKFIQYNKSKEKLRYGMCSLHGLNSGMGVGAGH